MVADRATGSTRHVTGRRRCHEWTHLAAAAVRYTAGGREGVRVKFKNREEAGRQIADKLLQYRDDPRGLILALPRGGVAVGY